MITVQPVLSKHDWNLFFHFPNKLYKGNPYYVPSLISDERRTFNPELNPAFEHIKSRAFLATQNGKVVGRIAALINYKLNETQQKKYMRFTRFDVIDDIQVSRSLFDEVFEWGKSEGMDTIIGPIGFSELDKQGLLVEGFDQLGMYITLYNHPYYADHLTQLGFTKDVDWVEYKVFVPDHLDPRIERISEIAQKRHGYRLLSFSNKKEVLPYAYQMFHMYNEAFAKFYGFFPLSDGQINLTIKQFLSLVSLDYIYVVVDVSDSVIGFGIMAPSLSHAMQKAKGHLFPFGFIQILKTMKHHTILDMYLIAVKPEYMGRGVNAVILQAGIKKAMENGVRYAETGPELEYNDNVQTQWQGFKTEQHKRRRCYIRSLTE